MRSIRRWRTLLLASVMFGTVLAPGAAFGATPIPCAGTVQLTGTTNTQVRQAGDQTFVEFDFEGLHDICLGDGSVVTGSVSGHLVQRTSATGNMSLRFDEVLSYGDSKLSYRGEATLSNGQWRSNVQTVGFGTGLFTGINGQGEFWFTGPASLGDVIYYVYGK